jgi:hypothetical protein
MPISANKVSDSTGRSYLLLPRGDTNASKLRAREGCHKMPSIKVHKVADIIDGKIVFSGKKSLIEIANRILGRLALDLSDPSFGVRTFTYKLSWLSPTQTHTSAFFIRSTSSSRSEAVGGASRSNTNKRSRKYTRCPRKAPEVLTRTGVASGYVELPRYFVRAS